MTEPTEQQLPRDPHDGIDAPRAGEAPVVEGTGAGDPLAGVRITDADAAAAVAGDEGPEHPGVRRRS